jgi:photosystem II stability/assembly factor-like uncharacterized protein
MKMTVRWAVPVLAAAALLAPTTASAQPASPAGRIRPTGAPGPAAVKVPAGFQPVSASFYSAASGVVLGGVGCRPGQPCRARLVATTDRGARWRFLRAPDAPVTGILFASRRDGWLGPVGRYGARVWATHDRGGHWRKLSLGGVIDSMAASAGIVYAVVTPNGGPTELFASPAGRNAWARVGHLKVSASTGSALAVHGRSAWFGGGTSLWVTADGVHWHRYRFACPAPYSGNAAGLAGIAAASPSRLWFLCVTSPGAGNQGKDLLRSVNGGKTVHVIGPIPVAGEAAGFAAPPSRLKVITLTTQVALNRSANGGKTWKQVLSVPLPTSWSPLSYVNRNVSWVVSIQPSPSGRIHNQLLRTTDAGASWHKIRF